MVLPSSKFRKNRLGRQVDEARKQLALSYEDLAKRTGYSERTIRNLIAGESVRPKTKRDILQAVGIDPPDQKNKTVKAADAGHGQYTRDQIKDYLGLFFAYRRSFDVQNTLIRTIFKFEWDEQARCMKFYEHHSYYSKRLGRPVNYDQSGDVFISNSVGLVHLVTQRFGAIRLITQTKLHHDESTMTGAVLTQMERPGNYFRPSSSPMLLRKIVSGELSDLKRLVGPVEPADPGKPENPGDPEYMAADDQLRRIQVDVVNFALV